MQHLVLVPAALALAGLGVLGSDDLAVDASIRQLRAAIEPQAVGRTEMPLLSSLRQLGDPSLRPYFYQLARHSDPMVRVNAVLGLAEIDPQRQLDPWMVRQIEVPEAQFGTVAIGLANDLINAEVLNDLATGDELSPTTRTLVLAAQAGRGEPVDLDAARSLARAGEPIGAALAACVLAQHGDVAALKRHRATIDAMDTREQRNHLFELFGFIDQLRLSGAVDFVSNVTVDPDTDPVVAHVGLRTVLQIDPQRGAALWSRTLGDAPSYGTAVRHALALLAAPPTVPVKTWDRLPTGDPLLAQLAAAGRARATGSNAGSTLIALIDLCHPASGMVALDAAAELDDAEAGLVYAHVIDAVEGESAGLEGRVHRAVSATAALFKIDPEAILIRLRQAKDDSTTQQAILMGLLETKDPAAGAAARDVKHIGFSRGDSLALILIAKHADMLDPEAIYRIGVIAAGGGKVSPMLQIQAAWLYLKHADQIEFALTATFAETD